MRCAPYRPVGARHGWDASGWCRHGCGARCDGRFTSRTGQVVAPGRVYTREELAWMAADLGRKTNRDEYVQQVFDLG